MQSTIVIDCLRIIPSPILVPGITLASAASWCTDTAPYDADPQASRMAYYFPTARPWASIIAQPIARQSKRVRDQALGRPLAQLQHDHVGQRRAGTGFQRVPDEELRDYRRIQNGFRQFCD